LNRRPPMAATEPPRRLRPTSQIHTRAMLHTPTPRAHALLGTSTPHIHRSRSLAPAGSGSTETRVLSTSTCRCDNYRSVRVRSGCWCPPLPPVQQTCSWVADAPFFVRMRWPCAFSIHGAWSALGCFRAVTVHSAAHGVSRAPASLVWIPSLSSHEPP